MLLIENLKAGEHLSVEAKPLLNLSDYFTSRSEMTVSPPPLPFWVPALDVSQAIWVGHSKAFWYALQMNLLICGHADDMPARWSAK